MPIVPLPGPSYSIHNISFSGPYRLVQKSQYMGDIPRHNIMKNTLNRISNVLIIYNILNNGENPSLKYCLKFMQSLNCKPIYFQKYWNKGREKTRWRTNSMSLGLMPKQSSYLQLHSTLLTLVDSSGIQQQQTSFSYADPAPC